MLQETFTGININLLWSKFFFKDGLFLAEMTPFNSQVTWLFKMPKTLGFLWSNISLIYIIR